MSLRASIDIGSNTILLLAGEYSSQDKTLVELANETRVTSLGRDLDKNQAFHPEAIKESHSALKDYFEIVKGLGIDPTNVLVTATEASRVAQNSAEFFKQIKNDFGFSVQLISPEGEAYYASYGVAHGSSISGLDSVIIMDVGGASTEFIKVKLEPFEVLESVSLPMGSVRGTDWGRQGIFKEKVRETLGQLDLSVYKTDYLIAIAGSMTSLAGMILGLKEFDPKKVDGTTLSFDQYRQFMGKIKDVDPRDLLEQYPFLGKRAKTILGGAAMGYMVGEYLQIKNFQISTMGLRYGTLFSGEIDGRFTV
ncbi:MAG: hypothetical protein HN509_09445 [Halobacteriovoraceae bacterium]|jgi:exopolyphosphatase / guanosine-5'-triphosphate,3'-diphosphate pyrophosphatase|nr:hypothetical protein [Halobacteriovoraceae bacterium]MBT5095392.1 hypothetical protein [Halobacteriovoraceae bacterium]